MCQLLGMNCAEPTDVTFSFTGFAARGGVTDHHADGWGIAFFEDKACRLFIDHQSSASSPLAEMVTDTGPFAVAWPPGPRPPTIQVCQAPGVP